MAATYVDSLDSAEAGQLYLEQHFCIAYITLESIIDSSGLLNTRLIIAVFAEGEFASPCMHFNRLLDQVIKSS